MYRYQSLVHSQLSTVVLQYFASISIKTSRTKSQSKIWFLWCNRKSCLLHHCNGVPFLISHDTCIFVLLDEHSTYLSKSEQIYNVLLSNIHQSISLRLVIAKQPKTNCLCWTKELFITFSYIKTGHSSFACKTFAISGSATEVGVLNAFMQILISIKFGHLLKLIFLPSYYLLIDTPVSV